MANTVFKLRRSSVAGKVPNTSTLSIGELGLNLTDKILYSSDGSSVFEIGANNTNVNVSNTITLKAISANGDVGTSGQVLKSNGSSTFWGTDSADVGAAGQILYRNSSNVLTTSAGLQYDGSAVKVNGRIESLYQAGDEGGEIYLNKPATNTSIINGVTVDIYQNKLRFFEAGGDNRGAYIDITAAANGVGTNLAAGSGTVTSVDSGNGLTGGPITGSGTLSILANTGIVANTTGLYVNSIYIETLGANSATYLGNSSGTIANVSSWITGNAATAYSNSVSYIDGKILTANSAITGNAATAYSNAVSYVDGKIATANSAITGNAATAYSNAVSYTDTVIGNVNTAITSNASAAYSNSVSYVDGLKLDSVTNTSITYIPVANTVKNAYDRAIDANTRAASAQSAAISAYSNAVSYVDGKSYVNTSQLSSNLSNYQTTAGLASNVATLDANSATYLGNSSGTIANVSSWITGNSATAYSNAVSYIDGKILTANSAITGNAATAYSNSVSYTDGKIATANSAITGNAATAYSNAIAFAANASNITSGTLPYAQIPSNVINTTANFTISGVHTYNANIILGSSGLSSNGSFGTAGHVLHSNGTATYWAADDQGVTSVASGNGLTGGPITTTGTLSVVANTGIVVNATGVYVNSTYIGTLSANNTTYVNGKTEANLNVNSAVYATNSVNANNADYLDGQHGSYYTNATNISTGTLAEARLPYRMDQNVRTSDNVEFAQMTLTGNLVVSGNVNIIGANNLSISDNMIYLNSNNDVTNPDIGVTGNYNDGTYAHTGIFRDASDGIWKVFDNYAPEPDANVNIDTTNTSFHVANFQANTYFAGNTSTNWFVANTSGAYHTGLVNAASFRVGTSFTANSTVTNTVSLFVSTNTATIGTGTYFVSNGNVGIGNSTPGSKLVVSGNFLNYGVTSVYPNYSANTSGLDTNQLLELGNQTNYGSGGVSFSGTDNRMFTVAIASNTAIALRTSSGAQLQYYAGSHFFSPNTVTIGTSTYFVSNGNVGIGVSSPSQKLDVAGIVTNRGAASVGWVNMTQGDTRTGFNDYMYSNGQSVGFVGYGDSTTMLAWARGGKNLSLGANSSTVMLLSSNGNVGVGTSSPANLLDVAGMIRMNSASQFNGITLQNGTYELAKLYGQSATNDNGVLSLNLAGTTNVLLRASGINYINGGNVGIGTSSPAYKLEVNGSFAATTKSFVIDHPTKSDMKLRYGSLEGPENGVYVRGKCNGSLTIELPDYWTGLIDEDSITVSLTAFGKPQNTYVKKIENNVIHIYNEDDTLPYCYYHIFAERKDVEKLVVEFANE